VELVKLHVLLEHILPPMIEIVMPVTHHVPMDAKGQQLQIVYLNLEVVLSVVKLVEIQPINV